MATEKDKEQVPLLKDTDDSSTGGGGGSAQQKPPPSLHEFESHWENEPFLEYMFAEIIKDMYDFSYNKIIYMMDILLTTVRDVQVFSDVYTLSDVSVMKDWNTWENPYHHKLIDHDSTYIMFETHTMEKLGGMIAGSVVLSLAYGITQIYKQYDFNKGTQPKYIHKKINQYRNQYGSATLPEEEFSKSFLVNGMAYVYGMEITDAAKLNPVTPPISVKRESLDEPESASNSTSSSTSGSQSELPAPKPKTFVMYNKYKNEKITITFHSPRKPELQNDNEIEMEELPKSRMEKVGEWIYGNKWEKILPKSEKKYRGWKATGQVLLVLWDELIEAPPMWFWIFWYFLMIAGAAIPAIAVALTGAAAGVVFLGPVGWALLGLMFAPAILKFTGFILSKYAPNFTAAVGDAARAVIVRPWNKLMFNFFSLLAGEDKMGFFLNIKLYFQNKLKEMDEAAPTEEELKASEEQQERNRMAGKFMFINELYAAKAKKYGFSVHQKINKVKNIDNDINKRFDEITKNNPKADEIKNKYRNETLRGSSNLLHIINGMFGFARGFFGIQFAIAFAVFVFLAHAGITVPPFGILIVGIASIIVAAAFIAKNVQESKDKQQKEIEMEDLAGKDEDKKENINNKLERMAKLEHINDHLKNQLNRMGIPAIKMPQPEDDRCYRRLSEQTSTPWTWVKKFLNRLLPFVAKGQSGVLIPRLLLLSGGVVTLAVAISFPVFLGVAIGLGLLFAIAGVIHYQITQERERSKRLIQDVDVRTHSLVHENELLESQMKCLEPKHVAQSGDQLTEEQNNHNLVLEHFREKLNGYKVTIDLYAKLGYSGAVQMQKIILDLEKNEKNSAFLILLRIQKVAKERADLSYDRPQPLQKLYTGLAEVNLWQEFADVRHLPAIIKANVKDASFKVNAVIDKPTGKTDLFKHLGNHVQTQHAKTMEDFKNAKEVKRKEELWQEPRVANANNHKHH